MKKFLLLLLVQGIILYQYSNAQNNSKGSSKTDSLWTVYKNKSQADTNRLKALQVIAWPLRSNNPDTAIILAEEELQLARKCKNSDYEGRAHTILCVSFYNKGNYPKALDYGLKGLKIYEQIGDKRGIGTCYNNIAGVYLYQSNYPKSLDYYLKALKIRIEIGDKQGTGVCYTNVGNVYWYQADFPKALEYYTKSLHLREEMGDKKGVGLCYGNIGTVYAKQLNHELATEYFLKALKIREELNDKQGIGNCYFNLGELYSKTGNFVLSLKYSNAGLEISKELGDLDNQRLIYANISAAYSKTGKYKEALENFVQFKALTDSIFNSENSKQMGDMKTRFEVEKKEAELKIKADAEQEKLKAVALVETKKQQLIIYGVAGVLLIVIVFSLFLYKRFKITERQSNIIGKQKVMVDLAYEKLHEKNKEVIDSINYASRIQRALLTSERYIERNLKRMIGK